MAYPNTPIQQQFNRYQDRGLVGELAQNDNGVWFRDSSVVAEAMVPGDAVFLDVSGGANTGKWTLATAGNEDLATHVLSFDSTMLNIATATIGNQTTGIVYAEDDIAPAYGEGPVFVTAGETILRGQSVQYDATVGKYIVNTLLSPKLLMTALEDAVDEQTLAIRVNRIS